MKIRVERNISDDRRDELNIDQWSIWSKDESRFEWTYDDTETFLLLEGKVTIELPDGENTEISEGDLVQCEQGLTCVWDIEKDLRKVFTFDDITIGEEEVVSV